MPTFLDRLGHHVARSLPVVESTYKDLHQHPELSMQEVRTADVVARQLRDAGYQVTEHVGHTGVVGVLENGKGPVVMLRADMDALPMTEETGLPYASVASGVTAAGEVVPVAHMCAHDMHTAWLLGAAAVLALARDTWQGTVVVVFQPAEETGQGSRAMLADGIVERFPRPDVILGQHAQPYRAGTIGYCPGTILWSADSLRVRFHGQPSHASEPQKGIDPIIMAASAVLRLQTIVSREVAPQAQAVVSIGEFHAGTAVNIIAPEAVLKISVRAADRAVREHVLRAITRICTAEARASNAPRDPEIETVMDLPVTVNDEASTERVIAAWGGHFGDRLGRVPPVGASEDFGRFGEAWKTPSMYWFVGGCSTDVYDQAAAEGRVGQLPGPHSSRWAPAIHPTLQTGIETMLAAAGAWLGK